jgi:hypothetical protein
MSTLPKLTGTQKQIEWAAQIREQVIADIDMYKPKSPEARAALLAELPTKSETYINCRYNPQLIINGARQRVWERTGIEIEDLFENGTRTREMMRWASGPRY